MKIHFFIIILINLVLLQKVFAQNLISQENSTNYKINETSKSDVAVVSNDAFENANNIKKLQRSQYKNDFYQLVNFYQPQINPLYCAIASAVMVINSLNYQNIENQIESQTVKPNGDIIEYKILLQQNFLNDQTDKIKNRDIINFKKPSARIKNNKNYQDIYDPGLTLSQLLSIIQEVYNLNATITFVSDINHHQDFRQKLIKVLSDDNSFLIANFDGKIVNKTTNGHVAPIVAFNKESDEVLVLDPALHKNKWFWVKIENLVKAMNTRDGDNYRGYLIISKK